MVVEMIPWNSRLGLTQGTRTFFTGKKRQFQNYGVENSEAIVIKPGTSDPVDFALIQIPI
jgi:hypothetical protein